MSPKHEHKHHYKHKRGDFAHAFLIAIPLALCLVFGLYLLIRPSKGVDHHVDNTPQVSVAQNVPAAASDDHHNLDSSDSDRMDGAFDNLFNPARTIPLPRSAPNRVAVRVRHHAKHVRSATRKHTVRLHAKLRKRVHSFVFPEFKFPDIRIVWNG